MTRLIVNNTDTAPGIFFSFQSITDSRRGKRKKKEEEKRKKRKGKKKEEKNTKPVATVNDFMIVIMQSPCEPII